MPGTCSVCRKSYCGENVKKYSVPAKPMARQRWEEICGIAFSASAKVCEKHFKESDFSDAQDAKRRRLNPGAVPSLLLPLLTDNKRNDLNYGNGNEYVDSSMNVVGFQRSEALFRVPADEPRRKLWNKACGIQFTQGARVCQEHFTNKDFINPPGTPNVPARLKVCAIPGIVTKRKGPITFIPVRSTKQPGVSAGYPITRMNACTQTGCEMTKSYEQTVAQLKQKIKKLEAKLEECQTKLQEAHNLNSCVNTIFTRGQIKKLKNGEKSINWGWQDISNAITLYAAGPKAYSYLYEKGFPLPHVSTIQHWVNKVQISEGIMHSALESMQTNSELSGNEKICVLSFDVKKAYVVYENNPQVKAMKNADSDLLIVMARGLNAAWKQPVFYGFDCPMTTTILTQIIQALHKACFPVVAIVSDMSSADQVLWLELGVSVEKPWFENPADTNEKIFIFTDVPKAFRLIRNQFLDTGVLWNDALLTSKTLRQVMHYVLGPNSDKSIPYKLTQDHLLLRETGRHKHLLAKQLFSNTTAAAIRSCHLLGKDLCNPTETAAFIQLMNDWFDVMNSKKSIGTVIRKKPYGEDIIHQDDILKRMDDFIGSPIIPFMSWAAFQQDILMTNEALRQLRLYVSDKYSVDYIYTNRLNRDVLEQFFNEIRDIGSLADHPGEKNFKYRLQKYVLGNHSGWTRESK